jgi:hypothetical protein
MSCHVMLIFTVFMHIQYSGHNKYSIAATLNSNIIIPFTEVIETFSFFSLKGLGPGKRHKEQLFNNFISFLSVKAVLRQ